MIDMVTLSAFVVSFVAGPLICAAILRLQPRPRTQIALGIGVLICVGLALFLQRQGMAFAVQSLLVLWLAWVLAVGMLAMAIGRRMANPRGRRWLVVIALIATTLPWFGLATARLMV